VITATYYFVLFSLGILFGTVDCTPSRTEGIAFRDKVDALKCVVTTCGALVLCSENKSDGAGTSESGYVQLAIALCVKEGNIQDISNYFVSTNNCVDHSLVDNHGRDCNTGGGAHCRFVNSNGEGLVLVGVG